MKTYTVRITRQARDHLKEIKKYITEELLAPDAAANIIAVPKKRDKKFGEDAGQDQIDRGGALVQ